MRLRAALLGVHCLSCAAYMTSKQYCDGSPSLYGCLQSPQPPPSPSPPPAIHSVAQLTYSVLATYPHDPYAFTQGLHYDPVNGTLLESTGIYGSSTVRRVNLNGSVLSSRSLPSNWFGEGLTVDGEGKIFQLTWRSRHIIVRNLQTLDFIRTVALPSEMREGWGIAYDGVGTMYASDGTSRLFALDPTTLQVIRSMTVTADGAPVTRLNELEFIHGEVWANIWYDDRLAVINPQSGIVRAFVDCTTIITDTQRAALRGGAVFNGIAKGRSGGLYVTGKWWPWLFHISVADLSLPSGPTPPPRIPPPPPQPPPPPPSGSASPLLSPQSCSANGDVDTSCLLNEGQLSRACACQYVWSNACEEPVDVQFVCRSYR